MFQQLMAPMLASGKGIWVAEARIGAAPGTRRASRVSMAAEASTAMTRSAP
ncbi:Uncharacterised protein [Mycobacterium tuberculosis]|nr:Uncharacterised protein [Mycobacterium tuberculosis]